MVWAHVELVISSSEGFGLSDLPLMRRNVVNVDRNVLHTYLLQECFIDPHS